MEYIIYISPRAHSDIKQIEKAGRKIDVRKIKMFLSELTSTPRTGTGTPEQLKHYEGEVWSRRINQKDRFVYEIFESSLTITIIQSYGHYKDK